MQGNRFSFFDLSFVRLAPPFKPLPFDCDDSDLNDFWFCRKDYRLEKKSQIVGRELILLLLC